MSPHSPLIRGLFVLGAWRFYSFRAAFHANWEHALGESFMSHGPGHGSYEDNLGHYWNPTNSGMGFDADGIEPYAKENQRLFGSDHGSPESYGEQNAPNFFGAYHNKYNQQSHGGAFPTQGNRFNAGFFNELPCDPKMLDQLAVHPYDHVLQTPNPFGAYHKYDQPSYGEKLPSRISGRNFNADFANEFDYGHSDSEEFESSINGGKNIASDAGDHDKSDDRSSSRRPPPSRKFVKAAIRQEKKRVYGNLKITDEFLKKFKKKRLNGGDGPSKQ